MLDKTEAAWLKLAYVVATPPATPRIRLDDLLYVLPDTGCEVSPSCFSCPLAECKYDLPSRQGMSAERLARESADRDKVRLMTAAGASVREIASALGCSTRAVFRKRAALRQHQAD